MLIFLLFCLLISCITVKAVILANIIEIFQPGGYSNPQWSHELFGLSYFDTQTYAATIRNYLVTNHNWNNESTQWANNMDIQFGFDWKQTVSQYVVMDALRSTSYFQNWWLNNPMNVFNKIINNLIERGKFPGTNNEFPLNNNCG